MRVIGITGGVGTGKSSILNYLEEKYNAKILIADLIAHQLMEPGEICYKEIISAFSNGILDEEGQIDRQILGEIVFKDNDKREILNNIVHPRVKEYVKNQIETVNLSHSHDVVVVEAALFNEDSYNDVCGEIWYIFTNEDSRRERLKKSRGYSDDKISAIFASQASEEIYREISSVVIDNNQNQEITFQQVDQVMKSREDIF